MKSFRCIAFSVLIVSFLFSSASASGSSPLFKEYTGSPADLLQGIAPPEAKVSIGKNNAIAGWDVKGPDGSFHRVSVNISTFNARTAKGCGASYTPNACAYQQHTRNWVSSYYYEKDWKIKHDHWSDAGRFTTLKTNVKREDVCVHRQERSGTTSCLPNEVTIARNLKKNGNYHYIVWKEAGGPGFYRIIWGGDMDNVVAVIDVNTKDGFLDDLPEKIANRIIARLPKTGGLPVEEEPAVKPAEPKVQEAKTWRPELEALPMPGIEVGTTALIPATDALPAKIVMKNGKPNSLATFHLKKNGAMLTSGGKKNPYQLGVKTDGAGTAEVLFYYKGGAITKPVEYDVIVMNDGKKATGKVVVGLGLAFDKIRAVLGQTLANNTYAFSLSTKSVYHPKLNVPVYLMKAEESGVWQDRKLGLRLDAKWLNRPAGAPEDRAYYGTAEIKPAPSGTIITATSISEPKYSQAIHAYPAVEMRSEGKHIYKVAADLVAMKYDGTVVVGAKSFEKMPQNNVLLVLSLENPDGYLKMLSCAMEPQDAVQYLIAESSKKIPGAGKYFDLFFSASSIVCGFSKGEYEKTFYELGNVLGGEYLDYLKDSGVIDGMSPKVQKAYKLAKYSYDKLNDDKKKQERDQIIEKTKAKYGWGGSTAKNPDDIDYQDSPAAAPDLKRSENRTTGNEAGREAQPKTLEDHVKGVKKGLDDLGNTVKDIFK